MLHLRAHRAIMGKLSKAMVDAKHTARPFLRPFPEYIQVMVGNDDQLYSWRICKKPTEKNTRFAYVESIETKDIYHMIKDWWC